MNICFALKYHIAYYSFLNDSKCWISFCDGSLMWAERSDKKVGQKHANISSLMWVLSGSGVRYEITST